MGMWSIWSDLYPKEIDFALYLLVCVPALVGARGQMFAAVLFMLLSEIMVVLYELAVPGYAVLDGTYLAVDFICATGLFFVLYHYNRFEYFEKMAIRINILLFACVAIESLKLMEVASGTAVWWGVRLADYLQLLTVGGAVVGGGKRFRGGNFLRRLAGGDVSTAKAAVRGHAER